MSVRFWHFGLYVVAVVALLVAGAALETDVGLPFDTTYRLACVAACLFIIFKLGEDYRGERWPRVSFWIALVVNLSLFLTPLVDRPASRGELMLFALPDVVVVLLARLATYSVTDVHQRAVRQQLVLALVFALVACFGFFALVLFAPPSPVAAR